MDIFFFFSLAHNDRGYGHGRFAGEFPVVQRQGKCGRKTRKVHISQPMDIGVCYGLGIYLFVKESICKVTIPPDDSLT